MSPILVPDRGPCPCPTLVGLSATDITGRRDGTAQPFRICLLALSHRVGSQLACSGNGTVNKSQMQPVIKNKIKNYPLGPSFSCTSNAAMDPSKWACAMFKWPNPSTSATMGSAFVIPMHGMAPNFALFRQEGKRDAYSYIWMRYPLAHLG